MVKAQGWGLARDLQHDDTEPGGIMRAMPRGGLSVYRSMSVRAPLKPPQSGARGGGEGGGLDGGGGKEGGGGGAAGAGHGGCAGGEGGACGATSDAAPHVYV